MFCILGQYILCACQAMMIKIISALRACMQLTFVCTITKYCVTVHMYVCTLVKFIRYLCYISILCTFGPVCVTVSHTSECPSDNGFCRSVPSGDWSNCLIVADGGSSSGISTTEGPSSIIASPFCGIGKRYRRLDCLDMSNQLAESM